MKLQFELVGGPHCGSELNQDDDLKTWQIPTQWGVHRYYTYRRETVEAGNPLCGTLHPTLIYTGIDLVT